MDGSSESARWRRMRFPYGTASRSEIRYEARVTDLPDSSSRTEKEPSGSHSAFSPETPGRSRSSTEMSERRVSAWMGPGKVRVMEEKGSSPMEAGAGETDSGPATMVLRRCSPERVTTVNLRRGGQGAEGRKRRVRASSQRYSPSTAGRRDRYGPGPGTADAEEGPTSRS
ncbi:MAG: hypothetical protein A2413_05530 [Treponema sp. RIFOXYC1_FULL_61_9]|nr:MAG: hypothetical protein A2413_05530 [Treponema sp. RIFOXYC1_FULL_61_9]